MAVPASVKAPVPRKGARRYPPSVAKAARRLRAYRQRNGHVRKRPASRTGTVVAHLFLWSVGVAWLCAFAHKFLH